MSQSAKEHSVKSVGTQLESLFRASGFQKQTPKKEKTTKKTP